MAYTKAQEQAFEAIAAQLANIGGVIQSLGDPITWETRTDMALPLDPNKMTLEGARDTIDRVIEAENTYNDFSYTSHYRYADGAVAVNSVLRRLYGTVLGKKTWFQDPEMLSVQVGPGEGQKVSVPVGLLQLPAIPFGPRAVMNIAQTRDPDYGMVLYLGVKALKSAKGHVDGLFSLIERELIEHSIYRGQAVTASETPTFIDVSTVRDDDLVFAQHTERRLNFRLFSVIEDEVVYIAEHDDGKKIVWLHGDYGTGKSKLAAKLAKLCVEHRWGFCQVRSGVDSFDTAMQMARLYAPRMVVFVEDAESFTGSTDAGQVSKMLDQLDGVEAKLLKQCLFVFTTNFIEKVNKGATRFGRADSIIRLGNLDRIGCERLAQVELGDRLAKDVNYDEVYAAMGGAVLAEGGLPLLDEKGKIVFKAEAELTPAFMRMAFNTAKMAAALHKGGGQRKVTTADILDGVVDLEEQLLIHRSAPEPKPKEGLSAALAEALRPMVIKVIASALGNLDIYGPAREAADSVVEQRIHGAKVNRTSDGETWAHLATN